MSLPFSKLECLTAYSSLGLQQVLEKWSPVLREAGLPEPSLAGISFLCSPNTFVQTMLWFMA